MRYGTKLATIGAVFVSSAAAAQTYGPPRPVEPKTTPAERAMAGYDATYRGNAPVSRCERKPGEITVCARPNERSPYRLPLPDERDTPHLAGEFRRPGIGDGPVPHYRGDPPTARFKLGRTAQARNATLKLIREQEEAKAAAVAEAALLAQAQVGKTTAPPTQSTPAKTDEAAR